MHSHHTDLAARLNHGAGEAFSEDFIDEVLIRIVVDCQKLLLRQEPTAFTLITGLLLVEPAAIGLRLIHCHSPVVHVGIDGVIAQVRSLPKFSNYIELGTVMNKMDSCGRYCYELSTVMNYAELGTVRL